MLVELLLSIALIVMVLPFLFRYQGAAITRAENVATLRQMENIQSALERYIVAHRDELLGPVGKNITRVNLADLAEFGVPDVVITTRADVYQLRILKSSDLNSRATLQGIVVLSDDSISPLRTRQIVNLGGERMGFVDGPRAYGAYGTWHTDAIDLGLGGADGIIGTTGVTRDNAKYLWRMPSDDAADATMLSPLNLGGHDITDASFMNARGAAFEEKLTVGRVVADNLVFKNRTTLDKKFGATNATVSGAMSSDGKNIDVAGTLTLADTAKFTSFTTGDLYVTNMTLAGLSIDAEDDLAQLKINQALDMTTGRIDAMFVTVGFAGSITPRLVVRDRIEDSINPDYFWDAKTNIANFADVSFAELARMAPLALQEFGGADTETAKTFSAVSANRNATAGDFMNAITEIQNKVRAKYRQLNLE